MNIKSADLYGEDIKEEIYMKQPPGFTKQGNEDKVLRLLKPLYGLKQARCLCGTKKNSIGSM